MQMLVDAVAMAVTKAQVIPCMATPEAVGRLKHHITAHNLVGESMATGPGGGTSIHTPAGLAL